MRQYGHHLSLIYNGSDFLDNRSIGIFDSGLGGLTTVKRLKELLPGENMIFLVDTGSVPYGGRSTQTLIKYAREDIDFFNKFNVKAVIVACNTVSAAALNYVINDYDMPIIGVIDAAVNRAVSETKNKKIGVIGTVATINSGIYIKKIQAIIPDAQVFTCACPLLVPLVENGRIKKGDIVIETVLKEYLSTFKGTGIDTLILACTHYPLLKDIIEDIMGPDVFLVDSGGVTAEYVFDWMEKNDLFSQSAQGNIDYFVTDDTESFRNTASLFLGSDITENVHQASLSGKNEA